MRKRDFLLAASGALVTTSAWSALQHDGNSFARRRLANWQRAIGESFEVGGYPGAALILAAVKVCTTDRRLEQYTLVFSAASAPEAIGSRVLRDRQGHRLPIYLDEAGSGAVGTPLLRASFAHIA